MAYCEKWIADIVDKYGTEYVYRQLAEECCELAQAALKCIRAMNFETPVKPAESIDSVLEEIADVEIMIKFVRDGIFYGHTNLKIEQKKDYKKDRMIKRMLGGD